MNKGDTPSRSTQQEEALEVLDTLEEEVFEEETETVEWDGSEAELVPDEDAEDFEDSFAGIKLNYALKQEEIYNALRSCQSMRSTRKKLIAESIIACIMAGIFFAMFTLQHNWLSIVFGILCLILAGIIWPLAQYSVQKNAKRLTTGEEVQMEIYPDLIEMGKGENKWSIPLNGTVKCRKTNGMFVLQTDQTHLTVLPMRCIEPSVLPDVEAIILSGTNQVT